MTDILDVEFLTMSGEQTTLRQLGGSRWLVVNVASACGATPQYATLQALHEAITKYGRNIKNSKHFPSSRKIVDDNHWLDEFKLRRSDDNAKPDAIRKSFNRARGKLQEYDYIREYESKIWCIDEPDRQDK